MSINVQNIGVSNVYMSAPILSLVYPGRTYHPHTQQQTAGKPDGNHRQRNPISFIAEDAFDSSASTLRLLIFSKAAFTSPPLLRLSNLSTFSVSKTPVDNIEQVTTFPFAGKLVNLEISYLGLSVMLNFRNLTSISNISLGFNNITSVPSDMFPMEIASIDLQFNQLNEITNTSFMGYPNSKYLHLNNNPITIISSSAFTSLGSLETLQLSSTLL